MNQIYIVARLAQALLALTIVFASGLVFQLSLGELSRIRTRRSISRRYRGRAAADPSARFASLHRPGRH